MGGSTMKFPPRLHLGHRVHFVRQYRTRGRLSFSIRAAAVALMIAAPSLAQGPSDTPYRGANHVPGSKPGWEQFQTAVDPAAPKDEPEGGTTRRGTPVNKRTIDCFPAEQRNVFFEVDEVAGPGGLQPFDYTTSGTVSDEPRDPLALTGRNAIRGQNTWMLWGEGNESFWGWLQEDGYGLIDFLVRLDSRDRDHRFQIGG